MNRCNHDMFEAQGLFDKGFYFYFSKDLKNLFLAKPFIFQRIPTSNVQWRVFRSGSARERVRLDIRN